MQVTAAVSDESKLESEVNEEIKRFEEFFQGLGNSGLDPFEGAILRTYLWWAVRETKKRTPEGPAPTPSDGG
jgi:flagellar capping protein FliD